ncbi:MAG: RNase adapter RapZ [Bacteroidales bacterium]|jgi:aminoglycoside/choline kinase family phosphotransferase|nr:RNase adapter RapZ [Bacteroidales bacterium]
MQNLKEQVDLFNHLFDTFLGKKPDSIVPLPESGSARKYFRLVSGNKSYIGTFHTVTEENRAFVSFARHFFSLGLAVPEVLAVSDDFIAYIQTDLGDTSLFKLVQDALAQGDFHPLLIDYYKDALSHLLNFQFKGDQGLDYSLAFPTSHFDEKAIRDDLNYFKYYFLKLQPEIVYNESELEHEFTQLTQFIVQAPTDFFMYRDFQSRNIMIHEGKTHFIDFQGGRKGPLQYDVVSLLFQVKAQIPEAIKNELLDFYLQKLESYTNTKAIQFRHYYPAFVYLRLMQVLGAYGYRGLIQKKRHFVESIPYAIKSLTSLPAQYDIPLSLPVLKGIFLQLSKLKKRYPLLEKKAFETLTINVNSFSYKKGGIPEDLSGNGGGFVFDCRPLPNPGREDRYKMLTGRDNEVIEFLQKHREVEAFLDHIKAILSQSIDNYSARGFKHLMVNFGCTGGQHRSVYCAETIANWLRKKYPELLVSSKHREQQFDDE